MYNETFANVTVTHVSALTVTKVAEGGGTYAPGDTIAYNITVCNIGNMNLTNVTVNDPTIGIANVDLGTLLKGECNSTEVNYPVTDGDADRGWVNNTVNVSANDSCGSTIYNETYANVSVTYNASLSITKTADTAGPVTLGDTINYTFTVCNTGNETLSTVTLNDTLFGEIIKPAPLGVGECWILNNKTYNVTLDNCTTGWINNTARAVGTDRYGKNVTAPPASWNVRVKCVYCIAGYKLDNESGSGLANWKINVKSSSTGAIIATSTTNDTGYWQVCGLEIGNYTVCEVLQQPGWGITAPPLGCHDNVSLGPANITGLNFTNFPMPIGVAVDSTGLAKEMYATGLPVHAVGSGFDAFKDVSIYILPFQTLNPGADLNALKIVGPVNVTTDANGNITPPVLVWLNPVPGHYWMVFDDPDGEFDPNTDPVDDFYVVGAVPLITPLGLVALIGLLSIVAISTLVRNRRR